MAIPSNYQNNSEMYRSIKTKSGYTFFGGKYLWVISSSCEKYDENGNIIKDIAEHSPDREYKYNSAGLLDSIFTYDKKAFQSLETFYYMDTLKTKELVFGWVKGEWKLENARTYSYDDQNRLISISGVSYTPSMDTGSYSYSVITYGKGYQKKERNSVYISSIDTLRRYNTEQKFIKDGKVVLKVEDDKDSIIYDYNDKGYLVSEVRTNGSIKQENKFKYDDSGNRIESFVDIDDGYLTSFEYDKFDRLVREKRTGGMFPYVVSYIYD